jgi:hypothetical protein
MKNQIAAFMSTTWTTVFRDSAEPTIQEKATVPLKKLADFSDFRKILTD